MKNGIFLATGALFFSCTLLAASAWSQQAGPRPQVGPQQAGPQPQAQLPQQGGGNQPAQGQPAQGQQRMLPKPFDIDPQHANHIDQVLKYWEFRSSKVHQYEAKFQRWEYDTAFGPRDIHKTFGEGTLKYEQPDKGLFKVETLRHFTPPKKQGEPATYEAHPGELLEHWLCDGKAVYEYNLTRKELREHRLPPDQQGLAIANGPLPFLFGAKAAEIKVRYWLRDVTPSDRQDEHWLEAWPKSAVDGENFKFVTIIIDRQEFLPMAIEVADRSYDPQGTPPNHSRVVYQFSDRKVYDQNALAENLQKLNLFRQAFIQPTLPRGWTRIVEDPAAQQMQQAGGAPRAGGNPQQNPRQNARQPAAIPR